MTKNEILKIINNAFKQYGFQIKRNKYYLNLNKVFIIARIVSMHGSYLLEYNFSIKAIHDDSERTGDMFSGYDLFALPYFFHKNGEKYLDDMPKETFAEDINEMLHRYFDPFKINPLKYIINRAKIESAKTNNGVLFMLTKKAQEYLGLKYE